MRTRSGGRFVGAVVVLTAVAWLVIWLGAKALEGGDDGLAAILAAACVWYAVILVGYADFSDGA